MIQVHGGQDGYDTAWGQQRMSFYQVPGYPTVWLDGREELLGALPQSEFDAAFNACRSTPTDVTLELSAHRSSGGTFAIDALVQVEPGGIAKSMTLHVVQVLDDFPTGGEYRNCFIKAAAPQTVQVQPGQTVTATTSFTISGLSWLTTTWRPKIKIIAWLQTPASAAPAAVHQAAQLTWTEIMPADVTNDGRVGLSDLAVLLSNFGMQAGGGQPDGDLDEDGDIDLSDLSRLLREFGL